MHHHHVELDDNHYDVRTHDDYDVPHHHEYEHHDFVTVNDYPFLDAIIAELTADLERLDVAANDDPPDVIGCGGHDIDRRTSTPRPVAGDGG